MMKYNLPRRTFVAHSTRGELVSSGRLDRESSLTSLFPKSSISFTQYLLYRTLAGFLVVAVTVTGSAIISKWLGVVTYECTPVCCLPIYLSSVRPSVRPFFLPSFRERRCSHLHRAKNMWNATIRRCKTSDRRLSAFSISIWYQFNTLATQGGFNRRQRQRQ